MKKSTIPHFVCLSAGLVLAAAPASEAVIIFQENFNYAAGDLQANSGGTWGRDGNATTDFILQDPGWGTGMAVKTEPHSNVNNRASTALNLSAYTNSTIYVSMWVDVLVTPTSAGGNGSDNGARYVAAGLWAGGSEYVYFGKRSDANAGWGFSNGSTHTNSAAKTWANVDGPTQIVLRIDFSSSGDEAQRLYAFDVNNVPLIEPAVADAQRLSGANFTGTTTEFRFSSGGNNAAAGNPGNANWGMFDNFGIYTEWSDLFTVNAGNVVPEPGSALLLAAGVAGLAMTRRRKS